MKRKIAVLILILLALCGCSAISSGYVTKKVYEEAYSWTSMSCSMYGKYGCQVYVPISHFEPEHYRLDLKNQDKTGWVYVSPETYKNIKVGEVYNDK